jgi:hypothetical protein
MSSMNWQYSEAAKCGKHSKQKSSYSFHEGGSHHDTYARQAEYVESLGNQWASENFKATRPYFA